MKLVAVSIVVLVLALAAAFAFWPSSPAKTSTSPETSGSSSETSATVTGRLIIILGVVQGSYPTLYFNATNPGSETVYMKAWNISSRLGPNPQIFSPPIGVEPKATFHDVTGINATICAQSSPCTLTVYTTDGNEYSQTYP